MPSDRSREFFAGFRSTSLRIATTTQLRRIHALDDALLALDRHATSKITSLEDLESVVSLGFRGEALPSVASVSRMSMTSRIADDDTGWQIEADGGALSAPAPAAHPVGTTVEVHELFYNTPARRRFLRTERTELGHIEQLVRRLALSRYDVGFELRQRSAESSGLLEQPVGLRKRFLVEGGGEQMVGRLGAQRSAGGGRLPLHLPRGNAAHRGPAGAGQGRPGHPGRGGRRG